MLSAVDNNTKLYCYSGRATLVLVDYFNGWTYEYSIERLSVTAYKDGESTGVEYKGGYGYTHLREVFHKCSIVGDSLIIEWAYDFLDKMEQVVVDLLGSQEKIYKYFGIGENDV